MYHINLKKILKSIGIDAPNLFFRKIISNSKKIQSGDLFIAVKGIEEDGRKYINQAIQNGSKIILSECFKKKQHGIIEYVNNTPIIYIKKLKNHLSFLSGKIYQNPSSKLKLIGITGTNGKTSTSHFIAQLVQKIGEISAVMGSIGNGILNDIKPSINTTSSAIKIQYELQKFVKKKVSLVAIEVSSHGLVQKRVAALNFEAIVFTNLTNEHLEYHQTMQNYENAKWLLFSQHKSNYQIINVDDKTGIKWISYFPKACLISLNNCIPKKWNGFKITVKKIQYFKFGTLIDFKSSWGQAKIQTCLIGKFQISNLMLAIGTLLTLKYPFEIIKKCCKFIKPISGRMELFYSKENPTIIVDYAHNPIALKNALITSRLYCEGKLWCIFGCGGERDKKKRMIMGNIAEIYSDIVILTNDNPRNEDPQIIINDILKGFFYKHRVILIFDRLKAIIYSIKYAKKNDVILIAGKGDENYQIVNNNKLLHSDREIVNNILRSNT
ncbi:MAG: UDP-N-acetylmuramoyl-L-alanyl-D-glutamate--2,6-diaminopimelate ligase [Arsenophonus sp.]|nr:MAG: UDP-N-acetylmuramoyl-L-alanyl-D-glutamate--2,6-diaminopimelate ligase [Arsenophonus sp.]